MNLDTYLDRGEEEVNQAIVQFAARRSYRVRQPWYLDGLRIEATYSRSAGSSGADRRGRIDLELKRKRGRTRLRINVGRGAASAQLAYELRNYLKDDRAYDCLSPPICPKCGSPVPNVQARYCGRCGQRLYAPQVAEPPPVAAQARALAMPSAPAPQAAPIIVERDVESAQVEVPIEIEAEQPSVVEPNSPDAESVAPTSVVTDLAMEVDPGHAAVIMPAMAEAEEDSIDPPDETSVEAEEESELPEEDRPRRALAEE